MSTGSSVTTVGAGPVPWTRAWDALAPAQRLVIGVAATAAGYYGLARLGFVVQYPGEVSAVWLPVGFAVAMLSLGDMRWLVGALLADLLLDVTPGGLNWGPAVTQTVGNMVEVAVGAMLVRAVIGPRRRLERPNQALALVGALMVAAALSATIGDLALGVANVVPWHEIPVSWRTWWLADTCGGLTIVPLALAWTDRRAWWGWTVRQRAEALMLLAAVVVLSVVAFRSHHPLTYAVFPALMVATLRLGLPAGTVGVAVAAAYAVGSTADNLGPFVVRSIDDQALNTQLYVLVAALTVLMLGTLVVAGERSAVDLADARRRQAEQAANERQRIARDLHDSVSQTLFSLSLQAAAAQKELRQVQHPGERLPRALGEVSSLAAGSLAEMRALIFELMPGALAEEGLVAALRKQAAAVSAREDLPVQVAGPEGRLPLTPEAEEHLYRIAQEALANVVKHAGAMRVGIEVTTPPGRVALRVADDGQGFDPDAVYAGHMGLHTMRARAEDAHGGLTIRSAAGSIGTEVEAWVPVRA